MRMARPEGRRRFPIGWILFTIVLVALVVRAFDVLLVLFLAVIFAIYLDAIAAFFHRNLGVPRALGLTLGLALSLGGLAGVVVLIVPPVASQVSDLLTNLPRYLADLDHAIGRLVRSIPMLGRNTAANGAPGILATALNDI